MNIILASASPRRAELLKQIGLSFTIQISNVQENFIEGLTVQDWVQKIACKKAEDVAANLESGLVIGADTVVVKDNQILGKPKGIKDAVEMLNFLSGSSHQVMTGIALVNTMNNEKLTDIEITTVNFRQLSQQEIRAYVASGEPMDKAGSYGIQGLGALLVEGINGCYFNVVGLPLTKLAQALKKFGVEVLDDKSQIQTDFKGISY